MALVKVRVELDHDADGWPPFGSEGLWAQPLPDDRYRLDNTPFFAKALSADDVVHARRDADDVLWVTGRAAWGGHQTVRLIVFRDGPLGGSLEAALAAFTPYDVSGEGFAQYGLLALDLPPGTDQRAVKDLLRRGEADGSWTYEEGAVTDEWLAL